MVQMGGQVGNKDAVGSRGARLRAHDFGWHHPGREEPAFAHLNFEIAPGEKVLLVGPSGAGKSTLLHALAGLLIDEDGQTQLGEITVNGLAPTEALGDMGLMQQDPESSVVLVRVGDDVAFGPENLAVPRGEIWERVLTALDSVGLGGLPLDGYTTALSGGQKQRLGLAGILAMHPGALLLDEPTAHLDPAGVREVADAVLTVTEATGATLVVIEHRLDVWARHMDRVLVLGTEGGITHDGPPATVLAEAREELIAAGVWVPGYRPQPPAPPAGGQKAAPLLTAERLAVTRGTPTRAQRKERARTLKSGGEPVLDLPAVAENINLTLHTGEHLALLGPNGAGKTTLGMTLAGLLHPARGRVIAHPALIGEHTGTALAGDLTGWPAAELADRIGLVFQHPEHQFISATVRDELEFGPRHLARVRREKLNLAELAAHTDRLLERLRLAHLAGANPFTLSGGEKRRLSVATALATRPKLLILDEPTFGQDATTWAELVTLIKEQLADGVAVISITHDADYATALGGQSYTLTPATAPAPAQGQEGPYGS